MLMSVPLHNNLFGSYRLCVARLYGGGPPLFIDPAIVPTPSQPLTPSFPNPPTPTHVPPGHQPVTPRFLMSLLAVSIYLCMPSLTAEALGYVTSTIGPFTVMDYLRFAYGEGMGPQQEGDSDPLVGLEHVAHLIKAETVDRNQSTSPRMQGKDVECFSQNLEALSVEDQVHYSQGRASPSSDQPIEKEDPADLSSESGSSTFVPGEPGSNLSFSYGSVSDKIGEACVCWLARWGADMLVLEQEGRGFSKKPVPYAPVAKPQRAIDRRSTVSGWRAPFSDVNDLQHPQPPLIWRRGGLTSAWIRALISSDLLFVKSERERYDLAKAVVELRRDEGILEEEEVEWAKMFTEGIYYTNMVCHLARQLYLTPTAACQTFDDLVYVSNDRSPTTGRVYVPERIIQAASWTQSMLRHKIVGQPPSSPPASPTGASRPKELGISVYRMDIKELQSHQEKGEESHAYWPIPDPSSVRIGESAGIDNASMDELHGPSSVLNRHSLSRSSKSVSSFFGLKSERCTAVECMSGRYSDTTRWVPYPPYRFGVEFWDVGSLREKSHLYSQTIWYAGTLFNVFVQMFRKKAQGPQLGIYLHRQSSVDPIPPFSIPSGSVPAEKSAEIRPYTPRSPSPSSMTLLPTYPTQYSFSGLPVVHSAAPTPRSNTPVQGSPSNTSFSGSVLPATSPPVIPPQPYRDPRAQVSAYFAISCASATGASVTRFTSNPDDFSVSQSWGWRSSLLRAEVCFEGDKVAADPSSPSLSDDINSMRITVILGVV